MPLLTAAEAQAQGVGLALDTTTLQAIIDGEEAEMIRRFGAHGDGTTAVTEVRRPQGGSVFLPRPIVSVSSTTAAAYPGGTATTIASDQRYVWGSKGRVDLYPSGFVWEVWDERAVITITYVPVDDRAIRKQVLLALVGLAADVSISGGGKTSGLGFSGDDGSSASVGSSGADTRAIVYQRLVYFPVV